MRRLTLMLLVWMLMLASCAAGFYFDRWLHRPIVIDLVCPEAPPAESAQT